MKLYLNLFDHVFAQFNKIMVIQVLQEVVQ